MTLNLAQIFYGRGARGYGILGASSGTEKFIARVEALCGAVGTPIGDYGGEPFLLSVPIDDSVIMVCGRRGAPDSMGRATLFFHALITLTSKLSKAKANAFSIFAAGVFADKMPNGEIGILNIDVKTDLASPPPNLDVSLPCVFRSEKPLQNSVCAALGERANNLSWATFNFQSLPDFDIQVLPPRVQGLQAANEYDASGKLVHSAAAVNAPQAEEKRSRERSTPSDYSNFSYETLPEKSNAMLKVSIVANLILVAACAVLLVSRKMEDAPLRPQVDTVFITNTVEKVVEKRVEASISDEQKAAIKREEINRLKELFQGKNKISHFDEALAMFPKIDLKENRAVVDVKLIDSEKIQDTMDKLRVYVNFVNTEILEEKTP